MTLWSAAAAYETSYVYKLRLRKYYNNNWKKNVQAAPLTVRKATPSDDPASLVATHLYSPASSFYAYIHGATLRNNPLKNKCLINYAAYFAAFFRV